MALVLKDRVKSNTTTTGTGTVVLGTAALGYQSFAVIGDGNSTYYTIAGQASNEWEVGIGTYYAANTSLSRVTILSSSNSNAAVTFSAGIKDVFVTYPAERSVNKDESGNVAGYTITGGTINGTTIGAISASSGAFTTTTASTSVTTPIVQATNSGGLALKNSAGTTQMSMGGGGGDNMSINVSTNINGANAQIDISPTGTGHVHMKPTGTGAVEIAPTNVGTIDNMTIGATTARNASVVDLSVTGTTSFDGSQGTAGQVLTSAGTGSTPTWTTPAAGAQSAGNSSIIINNVNITSNATIAAGQNGFSVGPVTTANGVTVTVASGQQWVVI